MTEHVVTNHQPRHTIDAWDLTQAERETFDYLDWDAIDRGEDYVTFFRYRGQLYDCGEFLLTSVPGWDGISTDTFFSATLIRFVETDSGEAVIVGRLYA
ncbi:MAG: hypothetical protein ACXVGB_00265 [Mycobacteriaceae bacterium]